MDYTGSIYRLIDRAEDEMKEYAQRVKQLSADELYRHSQCQERDLTLGEEVTMC